LLNVTIDTFDQSARFDIPAKTNGSAQYSIVGQLLLPFAAGQLLRPWIGGFVIPKGRALKSVDYGSIGLIVYSAFSHGVVNGIWHQNDAIQLVRLALVECRATWDRDRHPDFREAAARLFAC
jgi:predicted Na+-dependent transporter